MYIISYPPKHSKIPSTLSHAQTFLRKNKQATKKPTAKDESKTKNRSKEKQKGKRSTVFVLRRGLFVTLNPDLHVLTLVQVSVLQSNRIYS